MTLQNLDALSAVNDTYPYCVPSVQDLPGDGVNNDTLSANNFTSTFNLTFSLLRTLVSTAQCMHIIRVYMCSRKNYFKGSTFNRAFTRAFTVSLLTTK